MNHPCTLCKRYMLGAIYKQDNKQDEFILCEFCGIEHKIHHSGTIAAVPKKGATVGNSIR